MKPLTLRLKKQLRFRLDGSFLTENNFKSVNQIIANGEMLLEDYMIADAACTEAQLRKISKSAAGTFIVRL